MPNDVHCRSCGHLVKWFTESNQEDPDIFGELAREWGIPNLDMHSDLVERDCPHKNGTVISHCPSCDAKVDMWGMGPAGTMECDCWDHPPTHDARVTWAWLMVFFAIGVLFYFWLVA